MILIIGSNKMPQLSLIPCAHFIVYVNFETFIKQYYLLTYLLTYLQYDQFYKADTVSCVKTWQTRFAIVTNLQLIFVVC